MEELKEKLFARLRDEGTVNELRAVLRKELVKHLHHEHPASVLRDPNADSEPLASKFPLQATNWLLAEHLRRNHYEFTFSVFLLESGQEPRLRTHSLTDLLTYLGLNTRSATSQRIAIDFADPNCRSAVWSLLTHLGADSHSRASPTGEVIPSDGRPRSPPIDDVYAREKSSRSTRLRPAGCVDAPPMPTVPVLSEAAPISERDGLLRDRRMQLDRLDKLDETLQEQYRRRLDLLVARERDSTNMLERQKLAIEEELYNQRQAMLLDVARLQLSKDEWEQRRLLQQKDLDMEAQKLEQAKRDLQMRSDSLTQLEQNYEKWLSTQKADIEAEERRKYQADRSKLANEEARLAPLLTSVQMREQILSETDLEHRRTRAELASVSSQLADTQRALQSLHTENHKLVGNAQAQAENSVLRGEIGRLTSALRQVTQLRGVDKRQHDALTNELMARVEKQLATICSLQKDLLNQEELHGIAVRNVSMERDRLEAMMAEQQEKLKSFVDRLQSQHSQISSLHETVERLHQRLNHPQPSPGQTPNQPHHQPHHFYPSLGATLRPEFAASYAAIDPAVDGTYFDTSLSATHLPAELKLAQDDSINSGGGDHNDHEDDVGNSVSTLAELNAARARIRLLEREADSLERQCQAMRRRTGAFGGGDVSHISPDWMLETETADPAYLRLSSSTPVPDDTSRHDYNTTLYPSSHSGSPYVHQSNRGDLGRLTGINQSLTFDLLSTPVKDRNTFQVVETVGAADSPDVGRIEQINKNFRRRSSEYLSYGVPPVDTTAESIPPTRRFTNAPTDRRTSDSTNQPNKEDDGSPTSRRQSLATVATTSTSEMTVIPVVPSLESAPVNQPLSTLSESVPSVNLENRSDEEVVPEEIESVVDFGLTGGDPVNLDSAWGGTSNSPRDSSGTSVDPGGDSVDQIEDGGSVADKMVHLGSVSNQDLISDQQQSTNVTSDPLSRRNSSQNNNDGDEMGVGTTLRSGFSVTGVSAERTTIARNDFNPTANQPPDSVFGGNGDEGPRVLSDDADVELSVFGGSGVDALVGDDRSEGHISCGKGSTASDNSEFEW